MMEDQNVVVYTLDEALSAVGFGKYQGLLLAYAGMGWVADAMEIMILSFVGPALKSKWELSSDKESIITTVVFAGMLIGAYLWGLVSDTYGRTKSFLGAALVTAGVGLLSAFSPNYVWLVILRCMVGFGLGSAPVYSSWFLEFIPTPSRGTWMVVFSSFWTFGTIFEASIAWIVMPRLGWRWLLGVSSIPSFVLLLLYGLIPESPRYLCTRGRITEAHAVLMKLAQWNRTKLPPGILVSDQNTDATSEEKSFVLEDANLPSSSNIKESKDSRTSSPPSPLVLLSSKLIRTTCLLWLVYFGNTFSYYGIILLTSELSSGQSECGSVPMLSKNMMGASSLYINVFITSLAELPGLVLSALIVDKLGRKLSMAIMLLLGFILLLPLVMVSLQHGVLTTVSLFGARMFISATFTVACIYAPEVYPTSIRSSGVGVATAVGRIGGMICPFVAVGLASGCHRTAAVILFEVVIVVVGVSVLLFPFETKGRELTDTLQKK